MIDKFICNYLYLFMDFIIYYIYLWILLFVSEYKILEIMCFIIFNIDHLENLTLTRLL
jgi:hypothetical protein